MAAAATLIGVAGCSNEPSGIDARELLGEWIFVEGSSVGARSGVPQADDHSDREGSYLVSDGPMMDWILRVTDADERGFIGEWCSPRLCEPLAGAVRRDGTAVMVDTDTVFSLSSVDGELEMCTMTPGETFQVAACSILRSR